MCRVFTINSVCFFRATSTPTTGSTTTYPTAGQQYLQQYQQYQQYYAAWQASYQQQAAAAVAAQYYPNYTQYSQSYEQYEQTVCLNKGLGPVARKVDSTIQRIVIFSTAAGRYKKQLHQRYGARVG